MRKIMAVLILSVLQLACSRSDDFIGEFEDRSEFLQQKQQKNDNAIYTSDKYISADQKLFLKNYIELLQLFDDKKYLHKEYTAEEWLEMADLLIAFDEKNNAAEWGNLVIKIAIANRLLKSYSYILRRPDSLSEADIKAMLEMQKRIRNVLPAETPVQIYSFYHYQIPVPKPTNFLLNGKYDEDINEKDALNDIVYKAFESIGAVTPHEMDSKYLTFIAKEQQNIVTTYQQFYEHPMPILVGRQIRYLALSWDQYFYTRLLLEKSFREQRKLDKNKLAEIINAEFHSESRRWMPISTVDENYWIKSYANKAPKIFIEGGFLTFYDDVEKIRLRSLSTSKTGEYFTPHYLP